MRFSARLLDSGAIDLLSRITAVVGKLSKGNIIVRIAKDRLFFIQNANLTENAHMLWVEVVSDLLFSEFRMNGFGAEFDEIYLETDAKELASLLHRSLSDHRSQAQSLTIKLTKKGNPPTPHLSFEMKMASVNADSRFVAHDLPVHVLNQRFWDEYKDPALPQTAVSICMPSLKSLQRMIGGMKGMAGSHRLGISANNEGKLTVSAHGDIVDCEAHVKHLNNMTIGEVDDADHMHKVMIDGRTLHSLLSNHHLNMYKLVLGIVPDRMAYFYIQQPDITLKYFIPALNL